MTWIFTESWAEYISEYVYSNEDITVQTNKKFKAWYMPFYWKKHRLVITR